MSVKSRKVSVLERSQSVREREVWREERIVSEIGRIWCQRRSRSRERKEMREASARG